jgi:DeoR/GlpR family transcriptional regulator of sugar metabolism
MVDTPWLMPEERQRHILEHLEQTGRVLAADVARQFGISEDSARRDLRELAAAGLCRRVHGGALPLSAASGPFVQREGELATRKAALGRAGADLVAKAMQPHEVLFLDAGSTNLAVARALPPGLQITVLTNAPHVAAALVSLAGIDLIMIGGRVDPRCAAALGARALRDLDAVRIDLALLGSCAVDATAGLAAFDLEDAEFKQAAARAGAMVVTIAANEKLGTSAPFNIMPSSRLAHLVVEADAPSALVMSFQEIGVETHQAPRP